MIEQSTRRTKVIKSLDGRALDEGVARAVAAEPVDVLRVVYAREAHSAILEFVKFLREQGAAIRRLPVMLDLSTWSQGSVEGLREPMAVKMGDVLILTNEEGQGDLTVRTDHWPELFEEGRTVFFGYGILSFKALTVTKSKVEVEATEGGFVYPDMEIFVPSTRQALSCPILAPDELAPLLRHGIEYLIIPGQWSVEDIADYRNALQACSPDPTPWLIAKIDSREVYERLHQVVSGADGVMISRREMALSVNPATVPMITKEIIQLCGDRAKLVVTASEMLASMRRNASPTRAEVSDVANAVIDGTDAVVLSEEVSHGKFGSKAIQVMNRIIIDVEGATCVAPNWIKLAPKIASEMDAITYNAYRTAERVQAKALVCITMGGNTAVRLASFRPPVPIIAVTFSEAVLRRLSLIRGVQGILLDVDPKLDEVLPLVNDLLVRDSWLSPGDPIIFVTVTISPVGKEASNLFTIQVLQ